MNPVSLKAWQVTKSYGQGPTLTVALDDVSLTIREQEVVSIVGQSGSGKSTLLHLFSGIDVPTSGRIMFAGRDINRLSEKDRSTMRLRDIGFVFQFFNLIPNLTALDNALLPAVLTKQSSKRRDFAMELLDRVGMKEKMNSLPSHLSGGEQQRVAIVRALMNNPKVLFADEPTGNLDSRTGDSIMALLLSCAKESGHTLVFATHDLRLAELADRQIRIVDGKAVDA